MRHALCLVPFALVACGKPKSKTVDAGPAPSIASSAVAGPPASASASVLAPASAPPDPPSNELPPDVKTPRRTDVPASIAQGATVVLEGTLGAPEERHAPEAISCTNPVKLDRPLEVLDDHGAVMTDDRGNGAHPMIGNAKRICLWSWKGWSSNDGWMIPWGSHVVVRGNLWPPMIGLHPSAILMFDTELLDARPERKVKLAGKMEDGDTLAYVRHYDPATGTLQLDIAFLYYGTAAAQLARDRGDAAPADPFRFIANDSTQLRPLALPAPGSGSPVRLEKSKLGGYGWHPVHENELVSDTPYLVTIEKGEVTSFRQLTLERH